MRVALLGSGPSRRTDLHGRGWDVVCVGGGIKHVTADEYDAVYLADYNAWQYVSRAVREGKRVVVEDRLFRNRPAELAPWQGDFEVYCLGYTYRDMKGSGPAAGHWAINVLGATELLLAGCDCSGDEGYTRQAGGWHKLSMLYQERVKMQSVEESELTVLGYRPSCDY